MGAVFCLYSFITTITCYTWLAHKTVSVSLKDLDFNSYTIPQVEAVIDQSFSFFTYLTLRCLGFYFLISAI
ncbi:hypothetical protein PMIN06_012010 [Paraphaeosphaeria minitans]